MTRIILLLFVGLLCSDAIGADRTLILPKSPDSGAPINYYISELVSASLAATGLNVEIKYHPQPMNSKRLVASLSEGKSIDLAWLSSTTTHPDLIPVRFPLYKGIHGKRLLLIHKDKLEQFAKINSLDDLKSMTAVQHRTWSDYKIMDYNGLKVEGNLGYNGMMKAISAKLADYFPRSARTIQKELANQKNPELVIEPHLMLTYPTAYFIYLNKKNVALAKQIEKGLHILQDNGRFDALYKQYLHAELGALKLDSRTEISLTLPPQKRN